MLPGGLPLSALERATVESLANRIADGARADARLQVPVLSHWLRCLRRRSQRHRLTWGI